jgi:predicted acetyltransferase
MTGHGGPPSTEPLDVELVPVTPDLHDVVARLWQLYRHDLSEFRDSYPDADGLYRTGPLAAYLAGEDDRSALLVRHGESAVGFVLLRGLTERPAVLGEFFVSRAVRRRGVGHQVATEVMRSSPGRWVIAFQEENPRAARFWRRVATDLAGTTWTEQRIPVPDKPWLPPDVWLTLEVPPAE